MKRMSSNFEPTPENFYLYHKSRVDLIQKNLNKIPELENERDNRVAWMRTKGFGYQAIHSTIRSYKTDIKNTLHNAENANIQLKANDWKAYQHKEEHLDEYIQEAIEDARDDGVQINIQTANDSPVLA